MKNSRGLIFFLILCLFLISQGSFAAASWELSTINYQGLLNYQGKDITKLANSEAANLIYGQLLSDSGAVFTAVQSALQNYIKSIPGIQPYYVSSTVTVGSTLGIDMKGMGTYTRVTLTLPPATATINLRGSVLHGLIVANCAVPLSIPNFTVSGNLDIESGGLSLSDGVLQGTPKFGTPVCEDNVPVISTLVAYQLSEIGAAILDQDTSSISASLATGITLKGSTFLGLSQALFNAQFIVGGVNYGQLLAQDLVTFLENTEVNLTLYKPSDRLPASTISTSNLEQTVVEPLMSIDFPLINISSSLNLEEVYKSSEGTIPESVLAGPSSTPIPAVPASKPVETLTTSPIKPTRLPTTSPIRFFRGFK